MTRARSAASTLSGIFTAISIAAAELARDCACERPESTVDALLLRRRYAPAVPAAVLSRPVLSSGARRAGRGAGGAAGDGRGAGAPPQLLRPRETPMDENRAVAGAPVALSPCAAWTRRRAVTAAAALLGGLAGPMTGARAVARLGPALGEAPPAPATTAATSLHQEIELHAAPRRIYDLLLDANAFSAFSGDVADVGPNEGQAFSLFGGRITGRNVELVPPERIVQAWRSRSWAVGVYSVVRFALTARAAGTLLVLDHTGFPDGSGAQLASGWHEHYWQPLAKFLG